MQSFQRIGFPPPLLGEHPVRLEVYEAWPSAFLLEKPAGFLVDPHPCYPSIPSIVEGLRKQIAENKTELLRYKGKVLRSVFSLEPELSGAVLYATEEESSSFLRNAIGSELFEFTYHLISASQISMESYYEVDLPVLFDLRSKTCRISHKQGKKAKTTFSRLHQNKDFDYWEAKTRYPRFHQLRLHAFEAGILILGEHLYAEVPMPSLRAVKHGKIKGDVHKPLSHHIALHLRGIEGPFSEPKNEGSRAQKQFIELPYSKSFTALRRQLLGLE